MRHLVILLALAGCSTGQGTDATTPRRPSAVVTPHPVEAPGAALPVAGELEGCDPAGMWRAHGTFPHTGDCKVLPEAVDVEVRVVRAAGGYRLVYDGDGEVVPDNVSARDGACAVSFELHRRDPAKSLVLFFHMTAGGPGGVAGTGIWDEYEPGGDAGPARIRCSDAIALAVEPPGGGVDAGVDASAAAPERGREDDQ